MIKHNTIFKKNLTKMVFDITTTDVKLNKSTRIHIASKSALNLKISHAKLLGMIILIKVQLMEK